MLWPSPEGGEASQREPWCVQSGGLVVSEPGRKIAAVRPLLPGGLALPDVRKAGPSIPARGSVAPAEEPTTNIMDVRRVENR